MKSKQEKTGDKKAETGQKKEEKFDDLMKAVLKVTPEKKTTKK